MTLIRATSIAAAVLAFSAPVFAQAQAPASGCQPITEQQVAALFDRWNASLRTLDAGKVVANYAPDGVLLATVSNQPRTTTAQIHDYFVKFLKGHPQGRIDSRTVRIGCNVAQDVGTYTFTFQDGKEVHARYTYVYEFTGGDWKIAHHHSSAMPEAVAAR
ncbi:SgcJ/EcaC family oxidoreductase [Paracidovorax oryzae]|uniref:SgcJ/EcaC family oxidoreductase n=1 Tax=Paracidovorax oryzae TaxID=862720 RepID=UPI0003681B44|nr:SgcJ/EcaC family oxidoreductase [Paracidovorax oryzae]